MNQINNQVVEEILSYFGRTGAQKRPRIRKFHAELLLTKCMKKEKIITADEINRPLEYIQRMVKYSKGYLEFLNEEAGEIKITDAFLLRVESWLNQYTEYEDLDMSDENLIEKGIIITEDGITFDGKLTYSRFYKVISDEGESMNNPEEWLFNDQDIPHYTQINFADKNSHIFSSRLVLLKFYVLRKIDEVAFVTSKFVYCPTCGGNYVVPSSKIDFQQTYKCEKFIGDKKCNTALKKFPARKMIPTYIYEVGVEIVGKNGVEFKEYFLESFRELTSGFYTGMVFGRTEQKTNSFYFSCLLAKEEKSKYEFELIKKEQHGFFNLTESVMNHVEKVGFVIDREKAKLPVFIETMKKLNLVFNKEINLDHSLYLGAPGIGKTYALTLLHHLFYPNSGFISGPRFTIAGLTGGQKEIYYQDSIKKKSVPGLFSNPAFVFDEINNAQFLGDDKAINLFKSVALASSGTSSTVGGKEFPRISVIAATGNYLLNNLRHYENKVKKIYNTELKVDDDHSNKLREQSFFTDNFESNKEIPFEFDFYASIKDYGIDIPKSLKTAVLRARDDGNNYLTGLPKPLMERFYFSVLLHPKYDKAFQKQKEINVAGHLKTRHSQYSNRELIAHLFAPDLDKKINESIKETAKAFEDKEVEKQWINDATEFLNHMNKKYIEFFSMFNRIAQVHVFTLFSLSLINNETRLSFETKRIFERIISLLHCPIEMRSFHNPDFDDYQYIGETKVSILEIVKKYSGQDLSEKLDFSRAKVRENLASLETNRKIRKISEFIYEAETVEVIVNENRKN